MTLRASSLAIARRDGFMRTSLFFVTRPRSPARRRRLELEALETRLVPALGFTEFNLPTLNSNPVGISAGPDGNIWFTELDNNAIGRLSPAGVLTEFPIPTPGAQPAA